VQADRGTLIALLYSSNLQGEYEHCGCPEDPLGGLVRRATLTDRARVESDGVLMVDAGDLLLPPPLHGSRLVLAEQSEIERRARLILQSYARMGAHAVLPGEGDLQVGPVRLKRMMKSLRIPVIASNLIDRDGSWLFDRDRLITIAGVSIGIFGVVQPIAEDQALWQKWRLKASDPATAARQEVASLKARGATMIVALLHLGQARASRQFLEEVPGIDWAVQGHSGSRLGNPEIIGGARVVEASSLGTEAGRLDIHLVDRGGKTFSDRSERAQVLGIMDDHKRQLDELARRAVEDKTEQLREYYKLKREGLTAAIARETELARKLPTVIRGNWYENRIIPLDESIPDHPAIAALVAVYNRENARRIAAGLTAGIALRDPEAQVVTTPAPAQGSSM